MNFLKKVLDFIQPLSLLYFVVGFLSMLIGIDVSRSGHPFFAVLIFIFSIAFLRWSFRTDRSEQKWHVRNFVRNAFKFDRGFRVEIITMIDEITREEGGDYYGKP